MIKKDMPPPPHVQDNGGAIGQRTKGMVIGSL